MEKDECRFAGALPRQRKSRLLDVISEIRLDSSFRWNDGTSNSYWQFDVHTSSFELRRSHFDYPGGTLPS
jgi:hypothetical protein